MTANDLIAAFETLADAPDGVKRLRELVLQLAVRGKLVEQDSLDEPAEDLLERITRGRTSIEEALRVRKTKAAEPLSSLEVPFELPATWVWCRLQDIGVIVAGGTPPSGEAANFCTIGGHAWLTPADMRIHTKGKYIVRGERNLTEKGLSACSAKMMPPGTVVFSSRAPIGYVAIASNPLSTNQGFKSVVPGVDGLSEFLHLYLLYAAPFIDAVAPGTTFKEVSGAFMVPYPVPLPPLSEQRRIVARVDELMGLLDRLEAARTRRDDVRRAARDAALAALRDAEDSDAVEVAWERIGGQMHVLFTEPEDVESLRQSVLGLAVTGGLTAKTRPITVALDELTDPGRPIAYGVLMPGPNVEGGVPLVRIADLHPTNPRLLPEKSISPEVARQYERVRLRGDELLMGVVGSIGKVGVARAEWAGAAIARAVVRVAIREGVSRGYVLHVLKGPHAQQYFRDTTRTLAQPTLNVGLIRKLPVPLPPLDEQHRIVARVDSLMALCDDLEARLTFARDLHTQFAAAAVHHFDV